MKIILRSILVFCLPLLAAAKTPESLPEYTIGKSLPDKLLAKNESVFRLTFYSEDNLHYGQKIRLSCNGKEQTIVNDKKGTFELKVKPGKYKFQFFYNKNFFEITTDSISIKGGFKTPVNIYFASSMNPVMAEKPVIYVYSKDTTTEVTIKLDTKEKVSFTYPLYQDEWRVKATSTGELISGNKTYPYLFWEGNIRLQVSQLNAAVGFFVAKENLIGFFEEKLTTMGLTPKEQTDFITYWAPRMSAQKSIYIQFLFNSEINKYASLSIEPKPDNLFRVFMLWAPSANIEFNTDLHILEQKIPSVKRNGLTVIEWGGAEVGSFDKESN